MNNKQKPSEEMHAIQRQIVKARLTRLKKIDPTHIDMSALSFNFNKFNFAGSDYNNSTQNLQGTDSNQPVNAWNGVWNSGFKN